MSEVKLKSTDERKTRGGKKTDHQEEPESDDPAVSAEQQGEAPSSSGGKLEELTGMVKSLLCSQASRDQLLEKESTRQEQRWRS